MSNGQMPDIGALLSGSLSDPAILSTLSRLLGANTAPEPEPRPASAPDIATLAATLKLLASPPGASTPPSAETRGNSQGNAPEHTDIADACEPSEQHLGGGRAGGGSGGSSGSGGRGGIAPGLLSGGATLSLKKLLGGREEAEARIRLLSALRPYLCDERRSKLDTVIKLLKLAELGELTGILGGSTL